MNIELNNDTQKEVEYVEKTNNISTNKFKRYEILVLLGCLLLAFIIWCYANYLDDPIIQKEITIQFVLTGGEKTDAINQTNCKIVIYGEQSALSGVNSLTVYVERTKFDEYDTPTMIPIDYPQNIHSHTTHVELQLEDNSK